jgi:peptidyl-prolyl cis-trans isomerase C
MSVKVILVKISLFVSVFTLLVGCSKTNPQPTASQAPTQASVPTETALSPTPTVPAVPMALKVNGEGVPLAEYQASLKQLQDAQKAQGQEAAADIQRRTVLDALIDDELLAQAAYQGGFHLDDPALKTRIDALAAKLGGDAALNDWEARMGYDDATFQTALRRSDEAAWQRDQILASVPTSAEQVHVRQILVLSEDAAKQVQSQLKQAGANFATLAFGYDLSTGGDLGWFPRGYLTQTAVEQAAFSLQAGEISDVIQSDFGYHILQVVARDPNRQLSPEARQVLQRKALAAWLDEHRKQAQIEELAP